VINVLIIDNVARFLDYLKLVVRAKRDKAVAAKDSDVKLFQQSFNVVPLTRTLE